MCCSLPCMRLRVAVLPEWSQVADVAESGCMTGCLQHLLGRELEFESGPALLGPNSFIVQVVDSKCYIGQARKHCESSYHMISTLSKNARVIDAHTIYTMPSLTYWPLFMGQRKTCARG